MKMINAVNEEGVFGKISNKKPPFQDERRKGGRRTITWGNNFLVVFFRVTTISLVLVSILCSIAVITAGDRTKNICVLQERDTAITLIKELEGFIVENEAIIPLFSEKKFLEDANELVGEADIAFDDSRNDDAIKLLKRAENLTYDALLHGYNKEMEVTLNASAENIRKCEKLDILRYNNLCLPDLKARLDEIENEKSEIGGIEEAKDLLITTEALNNDSLSLLVNGKTKVENCVNCLSRKEAYARLSPLYYVFGASSSEQIRDSLRNPEGASYETAYELCQKSTESTCKTLWGFLVYPLLIFLLIFWWRRTKERAKEIEKKKKENKKVEL